MDVDNTVLVVEAMVSALEKSKMSLDKLVDEHFQDKQYNHREEESSQPWSAYIPTPSLSSPALNAKTRRNNSTHNSHMQIPMQGSLPYYQAPADELDQRFDYDKDLLEAPQSTMAASSHNTMLEMLSSGQMSSLFSRGQQSNAISSEDFQALSWNQKQHGKAVDAQLRSSTGSSHLQSLSSPQYFHKDLHVRKTIESRLVSQNARPWQQRESMKASYSCDSRHYFWEGKKYDRAQGPKATICVAQGPVVKVPTVYLHA